MCALCVLVMPEMKCAIAVGNFNVGNFNGVEGKKLLLHLLHK